MSAALVGNSSSPFRVFLYPSSFCFPGCDCSLITDSRLTSEVWTSSIVKSTDYLTINIMPEKQHRYIPTTNNNTDFRLYIRGKHVSFTRGKRNSSPSHSLIKIEGCDSIKDTEFYLGKRIAYVYRVLLTLKMNLTIQAQRAIRGSKIRVIWGKVTRSHGNSGVVRAKFRNNLPPKSLGANVRVV